MLVECVDSGCVGERRWGDVHLMAEEVVPSTLSLAAPFNLPVRGLCPVDQGGWLRHCVPGSYPTTLTPPTVYRVFPTCTVLQH